MNTTQSQGSTIDPATQSSEQHNGTHYKLGVLYVHGIGEQQQGDTILDFADPFICWLMRADSADLANGKPPGNIQVGAVEVINDRPSSVVLNQADSDQEILIKESWWANDFRAPNINDLSWWLLLVGTWATISHASKPLMNEASRLNDNFSVKTLYDIVVATFRLLFFYTPVAMSFQLVIILVRIASLVPLLPLGDSLSKLLVKLSSTLGDSFILSQSPIQRKMAVEKVGDDIANMLKVCDKLMLVAHSQGAAISYLNLNKDSPLTESQLKKIHYVSVGSGLDKLTELEEISHNLEFREVKNARAKTRWLYLIPITFAFFWLCITGGLMGIIDWPLVVWGNSALVIFLWCLVWKFYGHRPDGYSLAHTQWTDISASSDPVSNGSLLGPDDPREIINHRSLIKDHTSYFTNNTEFSPLLATIAYETGGIDWLERVQDFVESKANEPLSFDRSKRKQTLMLGTWLNRLGLVIFLMLNADFVQLIQSLFLQNPIDTITQLFTGGLNQLWAMPAAKGLAAFIVLNALISWADGTADKTADNLYFSGDNLLLTTLSILSLSLLIAPPIGWALMLLHFY